MSKYDEKKAIVSAKRSGSSLRNPSRVCRVVVVAIVWAVPGGLAGGMLDLFALGSSSLLVGFAIGAVLSGILGALLELAYG